MSLEVSVTVNGSRLLATMDVSSSIGVKGAGLSRLALTDSDKTMRDQFVAWCREANLDVFIDATGSIFARRDGQNNDLPAILLGSHLDTQEEGGRFDGVVGVLAALEVIRTLDDLGHVTKHPLCLVNWTNEEGARFPPPMLASGCFVGAYDLSWAHAIRSTDDGRAFGSELERIGYLGNDTFGPTDVAAYLELHIEQGPELDRDGVDIGIVTQAASVYGCRIDFFGETAHAGTRPMELRKNALVAAARFAAAVDDIGHAHAHDGGMATTGRIAARPNKPGILSEYAEWVGDVRHRDPATAQAMQRSVLAAAATAADTAHCTFEITDSWHWGGDIFARPLVDLTREVARDLGYSHADVVSRAGHDAYFLAQSCPTAMIFIPCKDGITHNLHEHATEDAIVAGANVLLHTVTRWADR